MFACIAALIPTGAIASTVSISGDRVATVQASGGEGNQFEIRFPGSQSLEVIDRGAQITGDEFCQQVTQGGAGRHCNAGGLITPVIVNAGDLNDIVVINNAESHATARPSEVHLGDGDDRFDFGPLDDRVDGDAGKDTIDGGNGNDTLDGGPGQDLISGGFGDDTINAADGEIDRVFCGGGSFDSVTADAIDDVAGDCEGVAAAPVVIGSGPSGTVASSTATFEFTTADASPPPGVFQCRLDDAAFTECISPKTFTNVADGSHTFHVRFDPNDAEPTSAATRTWKVDTTAPSVGFDSAPSGTVSSSSAQISFHSSEPDGATFRCRLDAGAEFDCASPTNLAGLADGPHTFSVKATDKSGNVSAPATASWTVSTATPTPVAVGCSGDTGVAAFGPIRAIARNAAGCFLDERVDGQLAKVSRGQVSVNGLTLTPAPGTRIILAAALGDGTVRADGPVTVIFGPPPAPGSDPIDVTLDGFELRALGTTAGAVNKLLSLGEGALSIAAMAVNPGINLEFSLENGGQVKATFRVALPRVAFKRLPGSPEGLTAEFSPTFSNDRGVTGGGRVKLGQGFLFGRKFKDLDLAYDHASGVFDGALGLVIGEPRSGIEPVVTGSLQLGRVETALGLNCGVRKVGLVASNLQRQIGPAVFLQRFGGTFECIPDGGDVAARLTAVGGVSIGPRIAVGSFETEAASVDGTTSLTLPLTDSSPFRLEAQGTGKVVDFPVGQQTITYISPSTVRLTGGVDLTVGGYGAQLTYGPQGTFVATNAFNIEAAGTANLFGVRFDAQAVFSSTGFAVCMGEPSDRIGFGRAWGGELVAFVACDVGPFRTAASATAAQVGVRGFDVAPGGPLTVVAAEGDGTPPALTVTGPGGERIDTPAGGAGIRARDFVLVQDADRATTFLALFDPRPGRWRVSAPAARRVRVARGLPPLRISAKVSGRGARRLLTWQARGLAGQRLQLAERANGVARLLTTTRRARGRLRFRPDPALGPRRTIEALAFNGAMPRERRRVARYRVTPPARPKPVRRIRLNGRTLSWSGRGGDARYEIGLRLPDTTTLNLTSRRSRLRLPALPRRGRLAVSIVAVNALGRAGRVAETLFRL